MIDRAMIIGRAEGLLHYRVILILSFSFLMLFSSTLGSISAEWLESGPYNHGFLAFLIAIYLVFEKRALLENPVKGVAVTPLLLLMCCGFVWLLAEAVSIHIVAVLSLYMFYIFLLAFVWGWKAVIEYKVPLLAVLLVLPIWGFFSRYLQDLSTVVTHQVLMVIDIPVLREGYQLTVPGGRFVVEEGCSGLGFLLCATLLALLHIHLNKIRGVSRGIFFGFAVLLALVSNWLRIVFIIIVGNATNMDHPIVADHVTFGWVVFSIMLIPFFLVAHFLSSPSLNEVVESGLSGSSSIGEPKNWRNIVLVFVFMVVLSLSASFVNNRQDTQIYASREDTADPVVLDLERLLVPSQRQENLAWQPKYKGADFISLKRYLYGTRSVLGLVVRYDRQQQAKELIYYENELFSSRNWAVESAETGNHSWSDQLFEPKIIQLKSYRGTRSIIYWYRSNDLRTANKVMAKIFQLFGILQSSETSYLVAIAIDNAKVSFADDATILRAIADSLKPNHLVNENDAARDNLSLDNSMN